jgi:hypothetical protein
MQLSQQQETLGDQYPELGRSFISASRLRHVTIGIPQSQEVEIPNEMLWHDFKQSVLGEVAIKVPTTRPAARLSHM